MTHATGWAKGAIAGVLGRLLKDLPTHQKSAGRLPEVGSVSGASHSAGEIGPNPLEVSRDKRAPLVSAGHIGGPAIVGMALILAARGETAGLAEMFSHAHSMTDVVGKICSMSEGALAGFLALSACLFSTLSTLAGIVWFSVRRAMRSR